MNISELQRGGGSCPVTHYQSVTYSVFYLRVSDTKKTCDCAGWLFIGVYLDLAYLGSISRPALFVSHAIVLLPPSVVVKEKIAANRLFVYLRLESRPSFYFCFVLFGARYAGPNRRSNNHRSLRPR